MSSASTIHRVRVSKPVNVQCFVMQYLDTVVVGTERDLMYLSMLAEISESVDAVFAICAT